MLCVHLSQGSRIHIKGASISFTDSVHRCLDEIKPGIVTERIKHKDWETFVTKSTPFDEASLPLQVRLGLATKAKRELKESWGLRIITRLFILVLNHGYEFCGSGKSIHFPSFR